LAGGVIPILATALAPAAAVAETVSAVSILALASAGGLAAYVGKAPLLRSALRVAFWGALAMGLTAVVGRVFGTTAG
ncbi:MAG: VIT1/CCC1 transporter family protein, partial [Sinobacteraceae bacterium]|nr:VIT1/CCC1 transporter family protein [Nevskiaceae bacterium]